MASILAQIEPGGTQACLEYVMALPGVHIDKGHVVSAGVSNGGFMAAPVASRYSIYTHAMLFHATCVQMLCCSHASHGCVQ